MNYGLVGLYAFYLMFVGYSGNAAEFFDELGADVKGFAPWIIAIVIIEALYKVDALKPAIKPFIGLAILSFTLKNYGTVVSQVNEITGLDLPTK